MYKFPVVELVDRYCIAKIKFEKLGDNKLELDFYADQLQEFDFDLIESDLNELTDLHRRVWDMEDDFKKFVVEKKYSLEEVGRRAIAVRDILNGRYIIKNRMAEKLNDPVRETKRYG